MVSSGSQRRRATDLERCNRGTLSKLLVLNFKQKRPLHGEGACAIRPPHRLGRLFHLQVAAGIEMNERQKVGSRRGALNDLLWVS